MFNTTLTTIILTLKTTFKG